MRIPDGNEYSLGLSRWLKKEILQKKLSSPWGIGLLIFVGLACGYLAANDLFFIPVVIAGALIGVSIVYFCLFKPLIGYYILNTLAFMAFYPNHLLGQDLLPLSTGVELLTLFVFLGTLLTSKKEHDNKNTLYKTAISIAFTINTAYLILEAFNPNVPHLAGWTPSFKRMIAFILIYIIAYKLIDTPKKFRFFLHYWLYFSFAAGLYGCFQQWFGLLPMEMKYIMSTPGAYELLFQGGQFRKFSFLSDVVSFGILSGSMAAASLFMGIYERKKNRRNLYFFMALIMLLGMAYSGTRTTTIMLPSAIALYGFMTIQNKTTIITLFTAIVIGFGLFFAPIYNPTLERIRSTFDSKEESLNLRNRNRHNIQPYIHAHPIGGGISTTDVEGKFLYPNHPLAGWPPDSGYLKVALEMGWIGFILYLGFNIVVMLQGLYYYFRMRNKNYKKYMLVMITALFSIYVTQYSQVSIGQIPGGFFVFSCMSLFKRLMEFDQAELRPDLN